MPDGRKGYRGVALRKLEEWDVAVWADVEVDTDRGSFRGVILPRAETEDDLHVVLKLQHGYNLGVRADRIRRMHQVARKEAAYKIPEKEFPFDSGRPRVKLLGTGGTIASRLDYRTGAVIPAFTPGELYGAVPELADVCNLETEKLFGIFSENMTSKEWIAIAKAIGREIERGVDGIVIGHGTDTMHYTGAALSYMVQRSPVPIILVGSQRSSDRPSSDAALNLRNAVRAAAYSDAAEVMVCMFGTTSDRWALLHRGTRVRKMHSSYRSTFRTIGDVPIARITPESFEPIRTDYTPRRRDREVEIDAVFEDKCTILYYYPNMQPDVVDALVGAGYRGIVIAGTGLGHVNRALFPAIERAIAKGVAIYMTVQTLWGYTQMHVYDTGRDLIHMGVVGCGNMIPETAFIKLGWALGKTRDLDEVRRIMLTPIAGDLTDREPFDGYVVLQGGLPEVEAFLRQHPL
ncbi:MAG: Glu-tRNA(Gln) amidotransferase subunit GatD [Deltaproteobacteria bacterium]|nr:Glu-tRNA(Gln) amidotransferase subunit GatD [Deltaproteobacteria bacterium]